MKVITIKNAMENFTERLKDYGNDNKIAEALLFSINISMLDLQPDMDNVSIYAGLRHDFGVIDGIITRCERDRETLDNQAALLDEQGHKYYDIDILKRKQESIEALRHDILTFLLNIHIIMKGGSTLTGKEQQEYNKI